jgi:hypothetical protein
MSKTEINIGKRDQYAQFGEDGIIENILKTLPDTDKWCVEFGAWDGIKLSNTYNLIKSKGYKSVLIEADKAKFKALQRNMSPYEAILVNEFVEFSGKNTLDCILAKTPIPKDFDFLSIDIDGNDYWILASLCQYRPKVICIEYNPSIPNVVDYVQPRDFSVSRGSSPSALCRLAKEKSYELVATTRCNLFFVEKSYYELFSIVDNSLPGLRDDSDVRIYAFSGYDGTIMHSGQVDMMWHHFKLRRDELQILPRFLRTIPSSYNFLQKVAFVAFLFVRAPYETCRLVRSKLNRA